VTEAIAPALAEAAGHCATAVDYVARAKAIAPLIAREAEAIERDATITRTVYEALAEQELFWMLVPSEFGGGGGLGIVEALRVIEEIACADGSTGWTLMANAFSTGIAAGFLDDGAARDMFAGQNRGITAGMILPTGKAVEVDGGYRVNSRYQFASGSAHATWIGVGFVVHDENGNPLLDDKGEPQCRVGFLPRADVEFLGNWNVMGMVGTGSYDYAVEDRFAPGQVHVGYILDHPGTARSRVLARASRNWCGRTRAGRARLGAAGARRDRADRFREGATRLFDRGGRR
jgi:alkylation response protein AidB-like acyl-CoA dehydrogenase